MAPDTADPQTAMSFVAESLPGQTFGFGRHETFPFRYGWLKKAVDGVSTDPELFRRPDAIVILGVGKNMVSSIRHWGLASRVLVESSRHSLSVSPLGSALFQRWDPYMEDPASLWLIHYLIVTNAHRAGTWNIAFTRLVRPDFSKHELLTAITEHVQRAGQRASQATLKRDLEVFVRTYCPSAIDSKSLEDSFDCPLVELGLLSRFADSDSFRFNIGPKRTLPTEILAFCLGAYTSVVASGRRSVSVHECLYGPGSPGQVFKLDENSVMQYLEDLESVTDGALVVDDTAGLKQVYQRQSVDFVQLLDSYYSAFSRQESFA